MVKVGRRRFALVLGLGTLAAFLAGSASLAALGADPGQALHAAAALLAPDGPIVGAACTAAALVASFAWFLAPRIAGPSPQAEGVRSSDDIRLQLVVEAAQLGAFDMELDTRKIWFSERTAQILERSNADIPALDEALSITHADDRPALIAGITEAIRTGTSRTVEVRFYTPGGEERRVAVRGIAVCDETGRAARLVGFVEDITKRHRMEEALRESEERWRSLASAFPYKVLIISEAGLRIFYNLQVEEYFGAVGPRLEDRTSLFHPDEREAVSRWRAEGFARARPFEGEFRMRRKDGEYRWHRVTLVPLLRNDRVREWIFVAHDIEDVKRAQTLQARVKQLLEERVEEATKRLRHEMAERRKIQEQLHHSQKLDAIGRLTGGIAHDLNNKLQVIAAALSALSPDLREKPHLRRGLLNATAATEQAAALIAGLLTFARQKEIRAETIDTGAALRIIADLLGHSLAGSALVIELAVPDHIWPIDADPVELEAAIMNLVVNARDAMAPAGGGTIRMECANVEAGEAPTVEARLLGECVRISVRDAGEGIAPEHLPKVFEPFFTTKPPGKGTGLGLSQVYGFAKLLGGTVTIESEPGRGTTVSLFLPRSHQAPVALSKVALSRVAQDEVEARPGPRGAEVLVVDDEPDVAAAIRSLLDQLGHRTRVAIGIAAAWAALEEKLPDLVLSDVTMRTQTDGIDFARELRERHPGLAVALVTGGALAGSIPEDLTVVLKPVTPAKLDELVQKSLAARVG